MYDHLTEDSEVVFDVRGEKRGKITRVFQVDGKTYYSILARINGHCGYVELFPRVGQPRVYVLRSKIS
jgi:predicted nucleic-acid-binding Zn-ribbon protein